MLLGRVSWFVAGLAGAGACTARPHEEGLPRTAGQVSVATNTTVESVDVSERRSKILPDDALIDWSANAIMKTLGRVSETMTQTEYSRAGARVDERKGIYTFDCSGMAEWVL